MLIPAVVDEFHDDRRRIRRRVGLPLVLFLATCVTTFLSGVYGWAPVFPDATLIARVRTSWPQGLEYMVAVIGVLLAHEMGHFLMTVRYRIPASYPIFIPMPMIMMTGTMGAVIGMDGLRANRRQLFDIGLAGPLAGLVVTIPLVWIGLLTVVPSDSGMSFGQPLLVKLLLPHLRPDLPPGANFNVNALYMAGWVGMLITGLNMMPVSQLDGGHIIYGLLGHRSRLIGRTFLIAAITAMIVTENYNWMVMVLLVAFIGTDHPPTANDRVRIGPVRWLIGVASLAIPVLCFTPTPLLLDDERDFAAVERTPREATNVVGTLRVPSLSIEQLSSAARPTALVPMARASRRLGEPSYLDGTRSVPTTLNQKIPAPKPSPSALGDRAAGIGAPGGLADAATWEGCAAG